MALTKAKKHEVAAEVVALLTSSKMTVVAKYKGTTVKAMQELRGKAEENGTVVKVVKNRLVKKALEQTEALKGVDVTSLEGMLMYAFNPNDEVAAAQVLNAFAKTEPQIEFVGAISAEGVFVSAAEVKVLANLPSKNQLIAGLINTLNSPVNNVMGGLKGNLHGLLDAVAAKATN